MLTCATTVYGSSTSCMGARSPPRSWRPRSMSRVRAPRAAPPAREVDPPPGVRFADRFCPCEAGAEPPLSLFGVPIYVDAELARQPWLLMRGGTHEDAIQLDTDDWLLAEGGRIGDGLGATVQ